MQLSGDYSTPVTMQVCVVSPSSAVTSMLLSASLAVAVTVVSVTLFANDAVYAVVRYANTGDSVTPLSGSALRLASTEPALVMTRARQFERFSSGTLGQGTIDGEPRRVRGVSN